MKKIIRIAMMLVLAWLVLMFFEDLNEHLIYK
jgi:hypothetical protein